MKDAFHRIVVFVVAIDSMGDCPLCVQKELGKKQQDKDKPKELKKGEK